MKKQYVVIYVEPHIRYTSPFVGNEVNVLLVLKDRPDWQKGFLNLVGGKVEENETIEQAALRELKEETGYEPCSISNKPCVKMGTIEGDNEEVHCFRVHVDDYDQPEPIPREGETEIVRWFPWRKVKRDNRLMPNLNVVLPLMMSGVYDWNLYVKDSMNKESYTMQLTMPGNLSFARDNTISNILSGV